MITFIIITKITICSALLSLIPTSDPGLLRRCGPSPAGAALHAEAGLPAAASEFRLPYPNFSRSNLLATLGSAFPFEAFITSPIKKPISPFLPFR